MKQKPKPTQPKRRLSSSEERVNAEHEDWIHDIEISKYRKSEAQQLADQFKKRVK